jgi:dihydroorotase
MKILLKKVHIINPKGKYDHEKLDILIEDGFIGDISKNISVNNAYQTIEKEGLHVSLGWFDTHVAFGEPGYEERETIANGLEVAAKSGFTDVCLVSATNPVIDQQSLIYFIKQKAVAQLSAVHPVGALTKGSLGLDMAELFDMQNAGAVAFYDVQKNINNPLLMKIALDYVQDFNGLIYAFPLDKNLAGKGVVHEGETATNLGLKGIPALAEEIALSRDLFLVEYTGGRLHVPTISTAKSVALIREAKAKGLAVTCGVALANLVLTDQELSGFDTAFKLNPPLRTLAHQKALIDGLSDGTIDCITTNHQPIDIEFKKMEFDLAQNGTVGLEAAFGVLMPVLPLEIIIEKLTHGRAIINQKLNLEIGQRACLTLFETQTKWIFEQKHILSKSKNCAFLNLPMQGKVMGTINQNQLKLNF